MRWTSVNNNPAGVSGYGAFLCLLIDFRTFVSRNCVHYNKVNLRISWTADLSRARTKQIIFPKICPPVAKFSTITSNYPRHSDFNLNKLACVVILIPFKCCSSDIQFGKEVFQGTLSVSFGRSVSCVGREMGFSVWYKDLAEIQAMKTYMNRLNIKTCTKFHSFIPETCQL